MSFIRSLNFILQPVGFRLERLTQTGLIYPRLGFLGAAFSLPIWGLLSWYFASLFAISPALGERGAECMLAKALSPTNITLFVLALVVPLLYMIALQNGVTFSRAHRTRWFISRLLVALSFSCLSLFSKAGAVAIGVGAYAVTNEARSGAVLIALGGCCLLIGELCQRALVPGVFRLTPVLRRNELLKGITLVGACIGIAVLLGGIGFGTWQADAPKIQECKLVVRYQ